MRKQIIEQTAEYVRNELGEDATGHDWFHVDRVRRNALHICKKEKQERRLLLKWLHCSMTYLMKS